MLLYQDSPTAVGGDAAPEWRAGTPIADSGILLRMLRFPSSSLHLGPFHSPLLYVLCGRSYAFVAPMSLSLLVNVLAFDTFSALA